MTPRDLSSGPLLLAAVLCLMAPVLIPVDAYPADPIHQTIAGNRQPNPAAGTDVYFKVVGPISGPPAPYLTSSDYPRINLPSVFGDSRVWMWIFGQQHLYFAAFVLGALFWIMGLELRGLLARNADVARRYDVAAQDVLGLVVLAVSGTAISGAVLLLAFLSLYPDFAKYLIGVFRPFIWLYGLLFVAFSLAIYLYYYMWRRMAAGFSKWIHATMGVVVNVIGNVIMMIANSWGSFMMSPSGVDDRGRFLGDYTLVMQNALWNPLNVHRFASHLIFGAVVIAVYAGYRALKPNNTYEGDFYNWMSHAAILGLLFVLFMVPFGGYWFLLEIRAYRQQMWITLTGGLLAWLLIILVMLVGALFLAINYYLWRRIQSAPGGMRYRPKAKWIFVVLTMSFVVYMTPHTLVMRAAELKAIGVQQHPVVANYGTEASKQAAVNIMIVVTMWSLLILWRSRYDLMPGRSTIDAALIGLFVVGAANTIWLGIIGYFISANVRVGLSVPAAMTTLHIIVVGSLLTFARVARSKPLSQRALRPLSWHGYFAVLAMAAVVTWLIGLGGYVRSAVRLFWHAMEVFRDTSPWAFTYSIGVMGNMITFNALLFWLLFMLLVWLREHGQGSSVTVTEGPAAPSNEPA